MKSPEELYQSPNPAIRRRAAIVLLDRGAAAPLPLLLEILDTLHDHGLGAKTEKVLLKRRDPALVPEMISRLKAPDRFIREVACNVLGQCESGDPAVTSHLLGMLDDPEMLVRRAAGFALAFRKDSRSSEELLKRHARAVHDDVNVIRAIECALRELHVDFLPHRIGEP
jgi:HEAT repeat protein